jgi:GDP-4-dehydro-6-deoxy-D-mannose reductase
LTHGRSAGKLRGMRVLITGAAGFAGSHMVEHCLEQGDEVWGTCRPGEAVTNLTPVLDQITLRVGDITKPKFTKELLGETRFDVLYHLAGITFVPDGERFPTRAYETNLLGGIHVLQAVAELQPALRLIMVSSAEVYGQVPPERMPVTEEYLFRPINVLAAGKAALEMAAHPFIHTYGLHVVIVRPFNHTGPRQRTDFVCSNHAAQVAQIEQGAPSVLFVGDLSPRRDFTDVRDVVRAYRLLAEKGETGQAYNLSSGKSVSVKSILDLLVAMSRVKVEIIEDPARVRKTQVMDVCGSYSKVERTCGWRPAIPIEKTIRDLLNWHRDLLIQQQRRKATKAKK